MNSFKGETTMARYAYNLLAALALAVLPCSMPAFARDVQYQQGEGEIEIYVNIGEPTEIMFEGGQIKDGFHNSNAPIAIQNKGSALILFGKQNMTPEGAALIVRLNDGRSYPIRVRVASAENPRDAQILIEDGKGAFGAEEEQPPEGYTERSYEYAPASKVSGLMREMVLVAEFGKKGIPGYTISDKYKGQAVVSDGSILAKIDRMFIGPNLWGYVLDTTNLLDQSQKIQPATFRIDGTRAVSASSWELAARPLNVEEQISNKHNAKVYIVTRSR